MRRGLIIGIVALVTVSAALLSWQPWQMTSERWIRNSVVQLRQMPPPPAGLASSLGQGEWAGQGYLLFTNGWACFASTTFHSSERVGDIGLLRASDGSFYICHFHFCVGLLEYRQDIRRPEERQGRPQDIGQFIEHYGKINGWERLADN